MDEKPELFQKYEQVFKMLNPDENGKVDKNTLKEFLENTLGELYQEDIAKNVIENMKPDERGMINIEV